MREAVVLAVFVVAYVLIATERVHRVLAALAGAAAMLLIGALPWRTALFSGTAGIDWNVIGLLFGMMVVVSVLAETGAFDAVAIAAVHVTRGRPFLLLSFLVVVTAVASAALDNVTTVLLLAPVTLVVCTRLGLPPVTFLIAEVFASNVGGMATLIGDPPNIIVGSRAGLTFDQFVVTLGPLTVVLLGVLLLVLRLVFAGALRDARPVAVDLAELSPRAAITDLRLLVVSVAVLVVMLVGFVLHPVLHLAPSVVALVGALVLVALSGLGPARFLQQVEWSTLLFFVGLFVMVGALIEAGWVERLAQGVASVFGDHLLMTSTVILGLSATVGGIVDNIPFVATMAPLTEDLVADYAGDPDSVALWWALVAGADLGGNLTAVGASANVVVLAVAARAGHRIGFWQFTRYGLVVTAVTVGIAWVWLWLRFFAFG
ncbi:MAG: hypothetical protein GC157_00880 [Frankiales bacterium]|nr:hypothetical protein [Frankiales bacterium]